MDTEHERRNRATAMFVHTKCIISSLTASFVFQGVFTGIMRATGVQAYAAVANFVAYYVIGLPLGISLALVGGLKTKGMWIGLGVADSIQVGVFWVSGLSVAEWCPANSQTEAT